MMPAPDGSPREANPLRDMPAAQARPLAEPATAVEPRGLVEDPAIPARRARFGHYVVLEQIGEGAMGVVLDAYDPQLDRKVAIKLLRTDITTSEQARVRMRREAQTMARLSHPNVAHVYEAGEVDGQLFLAMEFIDGVTLRDWMTVQARPWREVLAMFIQAGLGLAAAHAAGVVHRDFKPDNVMVGADGRVRVLDFGLSRGDGGGAPVNFDITRQNYADIGVTVAGSLLGTPAYMSPEQFRGEEADARSDQFGFCVALWEALHGRRPFAGFDVRELRTNILAGRIVGASAAVPAWLRRVLERGLSLAPVARWPDMTALIVALGRDPQRTRRRWAAAGLATMAVAAAGYGLAALRNPDAGQCRGAADELVDIWDDELHAALASAVRATGVTYAETTLADSVAHLDAYRDAWISAHTDACEAHRRGSLSDSLFDRRMACLRQRRGSLSATVAVLVQTTIDTVALVGGTAVGLPALAECADDERLMVDLPPPSDPAAAAALERAHERLARGRALLHMSRFDEARAIASELEGAENLPLQAEVAVLHGALAANTLRVPEALDHFERAEALALEARADAVASEALAWWIFTAGELAGRPDEAVAAGRRAWALVRRIGSPPTRAAFLHNTLASARAAAGDHEGSIRDYEAALTLLVQHAPDDPFRVATFHNLALAWTTGGRHDLARALLGPELARMVATHGACHPQTAELRLVLALADRGIGRLDEARAQAEESFACLTLVAPEAALRALNILFGIHDLRGDNAGLRHQLERAEPLLTRSGAPMFRLIFDMNRGELALLEGRLAEARRLLTAAQDTLAGDPAQLDLVILCEEDLARLDLAERDGAAALVHAARAAQLLTAKFSASFRARIHFTHARALRAVDDRERSLALADEARREYESAGPGWAAKVAEIRTFLAAP